MIEKIGFYDEKFKYAQDYELYLRAIHCGIIFASIDKPLVLKKFDENNITFKKRKQQLLYELSAKANFFARCDNFENKFVFSILVTLCKLVVPSYFRTLRLKVWK